MLPRVLPSPRRGETGRHPCGAPQARLMAFGRQGVTGAGTEPRGSTAWVRVTSRNRVTMTRLRMGARVAVPQDAPGRGTRPRRERRNRTEPERPGSLLWKGSPAVYGGRGRHITMLLLSASLALQTRLDDGYRLSRTRCTAYSCSSDSLCLRTRLAVRLRTRHTA